MSAGAIRLIEVGFGFVFPNTNEAADRGSPIRPFQHLPPFVSDVNSRWRTVSYLSR